MPPVVPGTSPVRAAGGGDARPVLPRQAGRVQDPGAPVSVFGLLPGFFTGWFSLGLHPLFPALLLATKCVTPPQKNTKLSAKRPAVW